jgi:ornithine decarboxylase
VTTTPYLELDLELALRRYQAVAQALAGSAVHYAVKANPDRRLLGVLSAAGSRFDVASPIEALACLTVGAAPGDLVYSNPVKRRDHVAEAAALGVRLFAVDSMDETRKIAETAPGSAVICRIATSGEGSDWPLSRKFGCSAPDAVRILWEAGRLGLDPAGVSFHVGSQQRDPSAWEAPIATSARIFAALRAHGLRPRLLDLGGGFPATYETGGPDISVYGAVIEAQLQRSFGADRPETLVEPGRGIVGDAGTIVATVLAVVERGGTRWVHIDAGVFSGLVETTDNAIRYRLETSVDGGGTGPCVLAGPTCDSVDVLYQQDPVRLPLSLREGDLVRIRSAGAYTTCYATAGFNGFAPMPTTITGS